MDTSGDMNGVPLRLRRGAELVAKGHTEMSIPDLSMAQAATFHLCVSIGTLCALKSHLTSQPPRYRNVPKCLPSHDQYHHRRPLAMVWHSRHGRRQYSPPLPIPLPLLFPPTTSQIRPFSSPSSPLPPRTPQHDSLQLPPVNSLGTSSAQCQHPHPHLQQQ